MLIYIITLNFCTLDNKFEFDNKLDVVVAVDNLIFYKLLLNITF